MSIITKEACRGVLKQKVIDSKLKWLNTFFSGVSASAPLPDEFTERQVIADFIWPRISRLSQGVTIADDPDAASGKCVQIKGYSKNSNVRFGIYDPDSNRQIKNITLAPVRLGKYHFYRTGPFELQPRCFLWTDWSWTIQTDFSEYYDRSGLTNKVEAFISIKTSGQGKEAIYAVARVIWVRLP